MEENMGATNNSRPKPPHAARLESTDRPSGRSADSQSALPALLLERTAELTAANARLEQEIAQRTRVEHERRTLEAQLRQAQKLEAVGQLTAGIAHDFNNILCVILTNTELMETSLSAERSDLRAHLEDMQLAVRKGATMIQRLLGFSRQASLQMVPTDLRQLALDLAGMLRPVISEDFNIEILEDEAVGVVSADPDAVEQMLTNLLTNARDAMPLGGTIRIAVNRAQVDEQQAAVRQVAPGRCVCLSMSDTGAGIDEETKARIFEPFFTTKPPGEGTGLGMAMVYGLMKQHGGFVDVDSQVGKGTTVKLYFPAVQEAPMVLSLSPQAADEVPGGTETILLTEDDHAQRRATKRELEQFGYRVLEAADGEAALALLFQERSTEIDLIITDVIIPQNGGQHRTQA